MTSSRHCFLIVFLIFCSGIALSGQRSANNWHFGDGISLDFTTGTPTVSPPSAMLTQEGCTSISDAAGNLLFYTNGGGRPPGTGANPGMIWNRNHEVMYNMEGTQGGGFSARQSAIAFPVPGQTDQYYLFTMEEEEFDVGGTPADQPLGRGLSYFVIDMSLNGGLGAVTLADQRVFTPAYEGLTAIAMIGADGYWVIAHASDLELVVVPVTADGVGTPQTYVVEGQGTFEGQIKATPDGRWIFCNNRLVRFDPLTGAPLNESSLLLPNISSLTTEFTPDNRFMYSVATDNPGRRIVRFDLMATDIPASASTLFIFPSSGLSYQMQMGPNGSLYFLEEDSENDLQGLSEISCPTTNQPSVTRFLLSFNNQSFLVGLPNYPANIFATLASTDDTLNVTNDSLLVCLDTEVLLNPINRGETYNWSTGSTDSVITVTDAGSYQVTITGSCQPTVESFQVDNFPPLATNIQLLTDTSLLCADQDSISLTYDVNQAFEAATWTILGIDEMTFADDTLVFPVRDGGQTIVLTTSNECQVVRDSFRYQNDTFSAELATDATGQLCPGDPVSFAVSGQNIATIIWEDGSTSLDRSVPAVDSSLSYEAVVTGRCGDSLLLAAELDYSNCPLVCDAVLPNLITPNRDGVNDAFKIFTNCPLEDFNLRIFNRWGQLIFETTDQTESWDGSLGGEPQPMDVYLYRATYRFPDNPASFAQDGQFSLVR